MSSATVDDLVRLRIAVGNVIDAEPLPNARRPAWKLTIDFGPGIGVKRTSAQITDLYGSSDLIGRQVLAATGLAAKQIGGFMSEVLVLGVRDGGGSVILVRPDRNAPLGALLE